MAKQILVKPLVTEKTDILTEKLSQYVFVVNKKANKVEIGKAINKMYGVNVSRVNTMIMPAKAKSRSTRSGILKGSVSGYKKAIVTLADGEEIDFFGEQ
ncbi:MAG: large subunit ribosomal protein L23 [Saprospiraceae bacterium]|jgi:large subunit ribosomal protein L23